MPGPFKGTVIDIVGHSDGLKNKIRKVQKQEKNCRKRKEATVFD